MSQVVVAQETVGPYPIYRTIGPGDGLPYQTATASAQDADGTYWIGCPVGVQRFVLGAPVQLYRFGDSLAPQSERWVYQLQLEGDSLFAYTGSDVHAYDRQADKWNRAAWRQNLQSQSNELAFNQVPIGKSLSGFQRLPLSLKPELPALINASVLRYAETRIFLGTRDGLYELRRNASGEWHSVSGRAPIGLKGFPIEGLGVDQKGNLLIGTSMSSVIVLNHLVLKSQWLALPSDAEKGAWGMTTDGKAKLLVSTRNAISYADLTSGLRLEYDKQLSLPKGSRINDLSYQAGDLFVGASDVWFRFRDLAD